MDGLQRNENRSNSDLGLRTARAFLAENTGVFGGVSDAYPVATDHCLVAANGYSTPQGMGAVYATIEGGKAALFDTLYGDILDPWPIHVSIFEETLGLGLPAEERPIARYAAALAEAIVLRELEASDVHTSFDALARRLGDRLPRALEALRRSLDREGADVSDPHQLEVSVGVCRVLPLGEEGYRLDLFAAGEYRLFLLDADGMHPLRLPSAEVILPSESGAPLSGRRLHLPGGRPFAVLLLSESACTVNIVENHSMDKRPGLIWHYRMRREAHFLRIVTSCADPDEFGERAMHFFTDRANGRDTASGAIAVFPQGEEAFGAFRADCRARLQKLENWMSLLPDGFDPTEQAKLPTRARSETAYIRALLADDPILRGRTSEALRTAILEKLVLADESGLPLPVGAPEYRRLTHEEIMENFRLYDAENDDDRAFLAANRKALRDWFSDHWITLRPVLQTIWLESSEDGGPIGEGDLSYMACLRLNARLGELLDCRRRRLDSLEQLLSDSLRILRTERGDWQGARVSDGKIATWIRRLNDTLPPTVAELTSGRTNENDRYRGLLTAYMAERYRLFEQDIAPGGFFAEIWQNILNGTLSEEDWSRIHDALEHPLSASDDTVMETSGEPAVDMAAYAAFVPTLARLSRGSEALLTRIAGRAADRRVARDMAAIPELKVAAVRASAYEDADWGEAVCGILAPEQRAAYFAAVRRQQEARELRAKRAHAYEAFRAVYEFDEASELLPDSQ